MTSTCKHPSTDTSQPRSHSNAWFVVCGECDKELSDGFNTRVEAEAAETMFWNMQDEKLKLKPKCKAEIDADVPCGLDKDHDGDCVQIGVSWEDATDTVTADAVGTCGRLVRVRGECELPATAAHDNKPCYSGRLTCLDPENAYPPYHAKYTITPLPNSGRFRVNGGVSMDDYWTFNNYADALEWIAKCDGQLVFGDDLVYDDEDDDVEDDPNMMTVTVLFERKGGKVYPVTARGYDHDPTIGDEDIDGTVFDLAIENPVAVTVDLPIDVLYAMESNVPKWELALCENPEHD